jgi:DNA-binding beta-propeller fold protein YncE
MYILGASGDDVNQYSLSTPWRIVSASFVQSFSVSAKENSPQGIFFKPEGTVMYVLGDSGNDVNEYNLSTAWNISTAVYNQSFLIAEQETVPHGLFIKPDGTKMYLVGTGSDAVFQYSLTGDATITWPSSIKWDGGVVASTPEDGKTSSFAVSTIDGGITYYGSEIAKEIT